MNSIVKLILDKGVGIVESQIPKITDLLSKIPTSILPDEANYCLPKEDLEKILEIRNQIMTQINNVSNTVNNLSKITETIQPIVDTTNNSLNIAKTVIDVSTVVLKAIPSPPGVPGALLTGYVDANNLVNNILPPILTTNLNKINSITSATNFVNGILLKLKNLLLKIDNYLIGCSINSNALTPLNNNLQQIENVLNNIGIDTGTGTGTGIDTNLNNINNNTYKGFILEIIEEQYTPTVKRRKAVAKNSQNIILLSTPLTFSTDTQTLINEIKLIIDSSDLKAN